jgi:cysteinyl-tRNA synthetase
MELRLYDTLTKDKRVFTPIDPQNVRMYVCGPTVYDFAHIGNARPVIVFDVLFRLLRHLYGADHVTYVRNITDVDDKINDRAARDFPGLPLNEAIRKVTETTAAQFQADVTALGCLPPTHQPRATEFVLPRPDGRSDMVTLIQQLIARGHAYEAGGEVLFDVQSMPDYGALSGRRLEEQKAGARIAVDAHKRNPADFVLWKLSSENEPGWDSPWGRGRPGWHIECSAMSAAYLGGPDGKDVFDIHGGGLDLIFPHHENEIAQSRCAHGTHAMANYWMHNGFLQVEGEKMSKSLGNFFTIRQLLDKWPGDVLRLQMLMTHYRSPIDWTEERSNEARAELLNWFTLVEGVVESGPLDEDVVAALCDDLNTSEMLKAIRSIAESAKRGSYEQKISLRTICKFLGFRNLCKPGYFQGAAQAVNLPTALLQKHHGNLRHLRAALANDFEESAVKKLTIEIENDGLRTKIANDGWITLLNAAEEEVDLKNKVESMLGARADARARKDFRESDRIRDELAAMGVVLKDSKGADGKPVTTWEIAR